MLSETWEEVELIIRPAARKVGHGCKTWILQRRNYGVMALDDDHFRLVCTSCSDGVSWKVRASKFIFTNMMDAAFFVDLDNGRVACNKCSRYARGTPEEEDMWVWTTPSQFHSLPWQTCRAPAREEYKLDMMKFAAAEQVWAEQYDSERFHSLMEEGYGGRLRRRSSGLLGRSKVARVKRLGQKGRRMLKRPTGPEPEPERQQGLEEQGGRSRII